MTTVYSIYTNTMVPTAQILAVLHDGISSDLRLANTHDIEPRVGEWSSSRSEYMKLRGMYLGALHLTNCSLQAHPDKFSNKELTALDGILKKILSDVVSILEAWALVVREAPLQVALSAIDKTVRSEVKFSLKVKRAFFKQVAVIVDRSLLYIEELFKLLDYTPATHEQWLKARTDKPGLLMRNGQISYWLTLARNMPMQTTWERLGVEEPIRIQDSSSTEGKLRLAELLASLPGYPANAESVKEIASSAPTLIPEGVSLTVKEGKLELTQQVPFPAATATHTEWKKLAKTTKTATVVCTADKLVKGLTALNVLVAGIEKQNMATVAKFERELKRKSQEATYKKLKATFSADELMQLKDYFKNES